MSDQLFNPAYDERSAAQLSADVEAAEQVEALAESRGWAIVVEAITSRRQDKLHSLIHGGPSDNAAKYSALTGEIKGLEAIDETVRDIVRWGETARATLQYREEVKV